MNFDNFKKSRWDLTVIIILAFATFLRLYNIGFQEAWLDEIHTLKESAPSLSFKEFYDVILFREGISHFYFLIIRFLFTTVGESIVYARLVSAVLGILSVYYLYKTGKRLFNQNAGYLAAVLLSLNLMHIAYSQEARAYSLFTFCVVLATYRLVIFNQERNLKNAIYLGITTGLIANAHSIGLLNEAVIFIILFVQLLLTGTKQEKIKMFKLSSVAAILAVLLFAPVYLTIEKQSQVNSFWVQAPNFDNIKQVFIDLTGKSIILFYTILLLTLSFIATSIFYLVKKSGNIDLKKVRFNLFFLPLWLFFCSGVLIIKSYGGASLILDRYFISIIPAIALMVSLSIVYVCNKYFQYGFVLLFASYSLYFIFIQKAYYHTITKTQFSSVTSEIINKKTKVPVFSSWGWLMEYYINPENSGQTVTEMTFDDYVTAVRNNAVITEAFWYMDGNSRPLSLSSENQKFLNENFDVVYSIDRFDCWAKYYEPIQALKKASLSSSEIYLYNNDFKPQNSDRNGNLMIFESIPVRSSQINLKKGKYELMVSANSLPAQPIEGKNAHMIVKVNNQEIANYYLSENTSNKDKKIPFEWNSNALARITLFFDNDLSVNGLDRNVVIYSVKLKQQK